MGFDSSDRWTRKTDVRADYVRDCKRVGLTLIDSASSKDGYWFVWSNGQKNFIEFALIEKQNKRFYLKVISEAAGPYYFDCPLKFLNSVPAPETFGVFNWRERVASYHATKPAPKPRRTVTVRHNIFDVLGIGA